MHLICEACIESGRYASYLLIESDRSRGVSIAAPLLEVERYDDRCFRVLHVSPTTFASWSGGDGPHNEESKPTTRQIVDPNAAYHHGEILPAIQTVSHEGCNTLVPGACGCKIAALLVVGHKNEATKQYMMNVTATVYPTTASRGRVFDVSMPIKNIPNVGALHRACATEVINASSLPSLSATSACGGVRPCQVRKVKCEVVRPC
jgi:hypothetical protein